MHTDIHTLCYPNNKHQQNQMFYMNEGVWNEKFMLYTDLKTEYMMLKQHQLLLKSMFLHLITGHTEYILPDITERQHCIRISIATVHSHPHIWSLTQKEYSGASTNDLCLVLWHWEPNWGQELKICNSYKLKLLCIGTILVTSPCQING